MDETYKIVRYYAPGYEDHPDHHKIIRTGLTLAEAQAHCQDPSTREPGVWFDGYRAE